jgi:hypothetical protein
MISVYFGVFVTVIYATSLNIQKINYYFLIAMTPVFLFNIHTLNHGLFSGQGDRDKLVHFLIENKLEKGFATYWNADVLTVLSNYKLMVSHIEGSRVVPSLFMATKKFYEPSNAQENFLLLDQSEVASIDFDYINRYLGSPDRILKYGNYQVYVYKKDFARNIPGWLE